MVKKLIKHELFALFRTLVWLMGAVLLFGVLVRISLELVSGIDSENGGGFLISTIFLVLFWSFSIMGLALSATFLSATRFSQSLFTGEGYLTFSLPVTPTQLLIGKIVSALIAGFACVVVIALSVLVVVPSSVWTELIETNFLGTIFSFLGSLFSSDPLVILEDILIGIAGLPAGLLCLYLVASIGQLFKKRRTLIAIALLFGISYFADLILIPLMEIAAVIPHLLPWLYFIGLLGFDFASFFIIRYILLHKVNLIV